MSSEVKKDRNNEKGDKSVIKNLNVSVTVFSPFYRGNNNNIFTHLLFYLKNQCHVKHNKWFKNLH